MVNKYEEIMGSSDELRSKLLDIIIEGEIQFGDLAKSIGISYLTLSRFAKTTFPVKFITLCKIKKYVETVEKRVSGGKQ